MLKLRNLLLNTFLPAVCVLGIAYNCLIAINGEEGIRARALVNERLQEKQAELEELRLVRAQLENRADLLSRQKLDPDALDEAARQMLGYAAPGEYALSRQEFERILREGSAARSK
ncbi:septum formation initiator family protein [Parvularcula sp. IMCC14364]|uniref:FtsB family cell division protein n=1 Tax=Parvularcula sp. IMCC14364 TaxID=3067902 RepID=UPI0027415833|nr:septum formation initiator family protein [Parvularcula sp. IMCC14364]